VSDDTRPEEAKHGLPRPVRWVFWGLTLLSAAVLLVGLPTWLVVPKVSVAWVALVVCGSLACWPTLRKLVPVVRRRRRVGSRTLPSDGDDPSSRKDRTYGPLSLAHALHGVHGAILVLGVVAVAILIVVGFAAFFRAVSPETEALGTCPRACKGFLECLYFSLVTFTSLGYGDLRPPEPYGILAAVEAFLGVLFVGLASGLTVYRLLRPRARVELSPLCYMVDKEHNQRLVFAIRHSVWKPVAAVRVYPYLVLKEPGAPAANWQPLPCSKIELPYFRSTWSLKLAIPGIAGRRGKNLKGLLDQHYPHVQGIRIEVTAVDETTGTPVVGQRRYDVNRENGGWAPPGAFWNMDVQKHLDAGEWTAARAAFDEPFIGPGPDADRGFERYSVPHDDVELWQRAKAEWEARASLEAGDEERGKQPKDEEDE